VRLQDVRPLRTDYRGWCVDVLDESRVGFYASATGEQAKRMTKRRTRVAFSRKTGVFGVEIYFRAQVFHRISTPRRHLFHIL